MLLCVTIFPIQTQGIKREGTDVKETDYIQGPLCSQVDCNGSFSKGCLTPCLDKESGSQKGRLPNPHSYRKDRNKRPIFLLHIFASTFVPFPRCRRFPNRAQGHEEVPQSHLVGENVEKGWPNRSWFSVYFKQSNSTFSCPSYWVHYLGKLFLKLIYKVLQH